MTATPLYETPVPPEDVARGDGTKVEGFIETYCHLVKDGWAAPAGTKIKLRPWMREELGCVYARRRRDGRYRHREALLGRPRKNAKSAEGSPIALYGLLFAGYGAEIYSCAGGDKDQAKIVFGVAKSMVEMDDQLSDLINCYKDTLEFKETGSIYKALSSESFTKEGLNPSVVVYDELHAAPTDELYNVMSQGFGARRDPLLISITTAGVMFDQTGRDSICYRRYQYGVKICKGEIEDKTFYMRWYGAPQNANYKDPAVHEAANPGYGDFLDPEDFTAVLGRVHEAEFRTKRLNQWVAAAQAWLPDGAWSACWSDGELVVPGKGLVLGFDGSKNGDTTALVGVTVEPEPQVVVFGCWERPDNAPEDWKVPRAQVKDKIREICRTYQVREIAWDEFLWLDAFDELADEGLPCVVFPQHLSRTGPATQRFYEMVTTRKLRQFGDPRLARHIANCQLKIDARGARLQKDARNSPRKIDLAAAAVMALDRAGFWLSEPGPDTFNGVPVKDIRFVW